MNPYIDREVKFSGRRRPITFRGKQNANVPNLRLTFDVVNGEFSPIYSGLSVGATIIDSNHSLGYPSKVSVTAKNLPTTNKSIFAPPMVRRLREIGISLPEERHKIALHFEYQTVSGFPINTIFQDFPELAQFERPRAGIGVAFYPVSSASEHLLDLQSYQFVHQPIFWYSWSQHTSVALNIIAGKTTLERAMNYYTNDTTHKDGLRRHHPRAKEGAYGLIEYLVDGRDLKELASRLKCPIECMDIYFGLIFRTLRYFVRLPEPAISIENIVQMYNKEYATKNGKRLIKTNELRRSVNALNFYRD